MMTVLSGWTDIELDTAVLNLLGEFPHARMAACSRALEHCRQSVPRGTAASLFTAMRDRLSLDPELERAVYRAAA